MKTYCNLSKIITVILFDPWSSLLTEKSLSASSYFTIVVKMYFNYFGELYATELYAIVLVI